MVSLEDSSLVTPENPVERHILYLSSVDQSYSYFCRSIFVYENSPGLLELKTRLEASLAKVSSSDGYYSWAGRLRFNEFENRFEIDCNNSGVMLATARSSMTLADVTELEGGGFTIALLNYHILADAFSAIWFVKNLASLTRGGKMFFQPDQDRTRFKSRSPPQPEFPHPEFIKQGKNSRFVRSPQAVLNSVAEFVPASRITRKLYPFTYDDLVNLKQRAGIKCSSFDALTALVWRSHSAVLDDKHPDDVLKLRFAISVRGIAQPPVGDNFAGNAVYGVFVEATKRELEQEPLCETVARIQKAKTSIDDQYLRSARDFLELHSDYWSDYDSPTTLVNSWPRVMKDAVEVDFGWGKPCKVEYPLHSKSRDFIFFPFLQGGFLVSVCLAPPALKKFEKLIDKIST